MKTRVASVLSAAVLALTVSACADTRPFVWGTTVLKRVDVANREQVIPATVMVCYNAEWHNPKDVTALAEEECGMTQRKAKFFKQDVFACPVLLPARAHFQCLGEPVIAKVKPRKSTVQPMQEVGPEIIEPVEPPTLPEHLRQ